MKRGLGTLHVLFLVGVLLVLCGQAFAQSVTVVGRAEIVGSNRDAARNLALTNAFREAVQQGVGVWVQSQTEVKDAALVQDQILTRAQGYVTDHEIVKEKVEDNILALTIKANVAVDQIGADIKSLVGRVSLSMGNPSITFVLTTWEKRGRQGSASSSDFADVSVRSDSKERYVQATDSSTGNSSSAAQAASDSANSDRSVTTREDATHSTASIAADGSSKVKKGSSFSKINEDVWVKYPDTTVIDSFNQEFKEKSFKLNAADQAREIALSKSIKDTFVNPFDRSAVRKAAEKEGVNFVARGEVKMLDTMISESTGNTEVTCEVGVEIIDVASGDIVAAYRNSATAGSSRPMEAKAQSIKKASILAARVLAKQTIETWQNAALNGKEYTVEVRNIKSKRAQERPILNVLESLGSISSTTNPGKEILLVKLQFKGQKKKLEDGILDQLGSKPGFSEQEFDGPDTVDGKIVFTFK